MPPEVRRRRTSPREGHLPDNLPHRRRSSTPRVPKRTVFSQALAARKAIPVQKKRQPTPPSEADGLVFGQHPAGGTLRTEIRCPPSPNLRRERPPSHASVKVVLNLQIDIDTEEVVVTVTPDAVSVPIGSRPPKSSDPTDIPSQHPPDGDGGDGTTPTSFGDRLHQFEETIPVSWVGGRRMLPGDGDGDGKGGGGGDDNAHHQRAINHSDGTVPVSASVCIQSNDNGNETAPPTGPSETLPPSRSNFLRGPRSELKNWSPPRPVGSELTNFRSPPPGRRVRVPTLSTLVKGEGGGGRDGDRVGGVCSLALESFEKRVLEKKVRLASLSDRINKLMLKVDSAVGDVGRRSSPSIFSPATCRVDFALTDQSHPFETSASSRPFEATASRRTTAAAETAILNSVETATTTKAFIASSSNNNTTASCVGSSDSTAALIATSADCSETRRVDTSSSTTVGSNITAGRVEGGEVTATGDTTHGGCITIGSGSGGGDGGDTTTITSSLCCNQLPPVGDVTTSPTDGEVSTSTETSDGSTSAQATRVVVTGGGGTRHLVPADSDSDGTQSVVSLPSSDKQKSVGDSAKVITADTNSTAAVTNSAQVVVTTSLPSSVSGMGQNAALNTPTPSQSTASISSDIFEMPTLMLTSTVEVKEENTTDCCCDSGGCCYCCELFTSLSTTHRNVVTSNALG